MTGQATRGWLARSLLRHAMRRLDRRHAEWAAAMANEAVALESDDEQLRWAAGCALASYRVPGGLDAAWERATYPGALLLGALAMTAYQWSADESFRTILVLGTLSFALGLLRPRRRLITGVTVGLVVTIVNAFETVSGVRPAYELRAHSLLHSLIWVAFVAPAVVAAAMGGYLNGRLAPAEPRS